MHILGLPHHLWDFKVFKEIGDFCGGFVRVADETGHRLHFRWARIAIWNVPDKIPVRVKVAVGGWLFELPLWVEKGPLVVFQPVMEGMSPDFSGGDELGRIGGEETCGVHSRCARGD